MHQNELSKKAMSFHKEIARKHRQQIFAKRRKQLLMKQTQYPLTSQCLKNYWQVPASKLYLYRDQIFQTLDDMNGEQLSEQQSNELSNDLLYLIDMDKQFLIPYTIRFRKDHSPLTATVVAFVYDYIDVKEGNYWLQYMNEDCRNAVYLNMQCTEQSEAQRWINDHKLLQMVVDDWGELEDAEGSVYWLLGEIGVKMGDFVTCVLQKLYKMNKQRAIKYTATFFVIIIRLMFHLQSNQRGFSFLTLMLNESISKVYQLSKFQFDDNFLFLVDSLLSRTKQSGRIIFSHETFQFMLQLLSNSYHQKFIDYRSPNHLRLKLSEHNYQQIHRRYIIRLIDVCLNHLRMQRLYKNKCCIDERLLKLFQFDKFTQNHEKFVKLLQLNNVQQKNTNQQFSNINTNTQFNTIQSRNEKFHNNQNKKEQITFEI